MPGKLTTHVLDTADGVPAAGIAYQLYRFLEGFGGARTFIAGGRANADGRCEKPILSDSNFIAGAYCLEFDAEGYFARKARAVDPFLGLVPVNFRITNEAAHYHVPLLLSPFGYTTYRGS